MQKLHIKNYFLNLTNEIEKDIIFFGMWGIFSGYLFVAEYNFRRQGILKSGKSLAESVFTDFMSWNLFLVAGLIFVMIASLNVLTTRIKPISLFFEPIVKHADIRLAQMASAMICYLIGTSLFVFLFHLCRFDVNGVWICALLILVVGMITGLYFCLSNVARQTKQPTIGDYIVNFVIFMIALGTLIYFAANGMH